MGYDENREARGKICTWGRFNRGNDAKCVIKRGIIAEAVPIPVGLQQVVVLQTWQVPSLFLYNMLRISFGFYSSHLETNDCILMFVSWAETRFWNGIVLRTCGYLLYGQVLGDYVDYVVSVWTSARRLCGLCCIDLVVILFIVESCCNWTIYYPLYLIH